MALTCTTISGGKNRGPARAWPFFQARQSFQEESFSPEADHVAADGESGGDLVILLALGGQENNFRPDHLKVWQRILPRPALQDGPLLWSEINNELAFSRHNIPSLLGDIITEEESEVNNNMLPYLSERVLSWLTGAAAAVEFSRRQVFPFLSLCHFAPWRENSSLGS